MSSRRQDRVFPLAGPRRDVQADVSDDTVMEKTEIDRLKQAVARDRKGSTCRGKAFNPKLRAQVVAHTQQRVQSGERLPAIAASMGIKYDTLRYWIEGPSPKRADKSSAFRPVRVTEGQPSAAAGVTLFGPGGTRIEGLSLEQAAALLRRMS